MEARRQVFQKYLRNIINILQEKNPELCSDTCQSKLVALLPFFGWVCHSFYVGLCIFVVGIVFFWLLLSIPLRYLLYVIHLSCIYLIDLYLESCHLLNDGGDVVCEHPFTFTLNDVIHIITEVTPVVCEHPFTFTLKKKIEILCIPFLLIL